MRQLTLAALIVALVALVALVARARGRFALNRTRGFVSRVDGSRYRVHAAHGSPERAADLLAELNRRAIELLRVLRHRYLRGQAGDDGARSEASRRLLARYSPDTLIENSPRGPGGDTSYTVGKGAVVALCLRARGAGAPLHDLDTLTFVMFHELAHIAVEDVDHPPRFWSAFRFLLEEAERAGVYVSPPFALAPRAYCGLTIDYNPRYDPTTTSL